MLPRYPIKTLIIIASSAVLVALSIYLSQSGKNKEDERAKIQKNTLYIAMDSKIHSGDPRMIGGDANSQYIETLRFLPLIGSNENGDLEYLLAEEIIEKSNKSWLVKIKSGIVFNNGNPLTAEDVVATYQSVMQTPKGLPPSPRKAVFKSVVVFKATSSTEILIELSEPDSSFLNNLTLGILPKDVALEAKANEVNGKGYESGPYILQETSTSSWKFTRNEKFNLLEKPKVENLEFKIITDSGTRYAALAKGDIDIAQNAIDDDKISLIQKSLTDKFTVLTAPKLSTSFVAFNFRDPILSNVKVRQAIAYAIDRKSILQFRLQGRAQLATSMFPPSHYYFDKSIQEIKYDPQKAKALLKEANIPEGISFPIKVSSSNKQTVEVAKAIAANLKDVGIQATVEMLEFNVFLDQLKKGVVKVWIANWVGFKDPDHLRFAFATNMIPPEGGNRGVFSNTSVDELLQEGREESKAERRKMIYDQAQQILASEMPYVYLWHGLNVAVLGKNIEGYKLYADGRYWSLINVTKK